VKCIQFDCRCYSKTWNPAFVGMTRWIWTFSCYLLLPTLLLYNKFPNIQINNDRFCKIILDFHVVGLYIINTTAHMIRFHMFRKRTNKKRSKSQIRDRRQLELLLTATPMPVIMEYPNTCPCCGSPGFVYACHVRCAHCGFMPACDD